MLHLVHGANDSLFAQVGEQVFGLFAQQDLLLQVILTGLLLDIQLVTAPAEEVVADFAEVLLQVHFV